MSSSWARSPPACRRKDRKKVLMFGVGMALVFLIAFAVIATQLLKVTGLVFAGGLLLLWVAYNMFRELRPRRSSIIADDPETAASRRPAADQDLASGRDPDHPRRPVDEPRQRARWSRRSRARIRRCCSSA